MERPTPEATARGDLAAPLPRADRGLRRGIAWPAWALLALLASAAALRLWAAAPNPGPTRFWDERYLVANTAAVLENGWTATRNVYYPGLGHLPTAVTLATARRLGADQDSIIGSPRQLGPLGYRVARVVSVAWGLVGILFTFLLGRRLAGEGAGLGAAALLALTPWHLRQSILFKPDIALTALVVVTLWCCLRLLERDSAIRWMLLWGSAALAFSAKWNAAPLVIPLLIAAGIRIRRSGGRAPIVRCLGGAAAGVALIVALNPSLILEPDSYRRDLAKTATHYEGRAERAEADHWQMPIHAVVSLASDDFLGVSLATLGLMGLGWLAWGGARRDRSPPHRVRAAAGAAESAEAHDDAVLGWRLVAGWVVAYVVVYTLATAYPSPHNWLPILPGAALAAAAAGVALGRRAGRRWGTPAAVAVALLLAFPVLGRAREVGRLAVQEAVPTTSQHAERLLADAFGRDLDGRVVLSQVPLHDRLRSFAVQGRTLDPRQSRLLALPLAGAPAPAEAADADAAVWRGDGETCGLDSDAPLVGDLHRVTVRPFRARGEPLCVLVRPWERVGAARPQRLASGDGPPLVSTAPAPPGSPPDGRPERIVVDLVLTDVAEDDRLRLVADRSEDDGGALVEPCHLLRRAGRRTFCRTRRFDPPDAGGSLGVDGSFRLGNATVHRWRPPERPSR